MKKAIGLIIIAMLILNIVPLVSAEKSNAGTESINSSDSTNSNNDINIVENEDPALENEEMIEDVEVIEVESEEEQTTCLESLRDRFPKVNENRLRERCIFADSEDDSKPEPRLIAERVCERVENSLKKITEMRQEKEFRKYYANREFKARKIIKEKIETARKRFQEAQEKYQTAREKYQKSKERIQDFKERRQSCSGDEESDECGLLKADTAEFLSNSADIVISNLEKLQSKLEESEDLSEEEALEMISEIETAISDVQDIQDKIEALEEPTKDELNDLAKELRIVWQNVEKAIKISSGKLINARIGGVIVKSNQLKARLELVLDRAEQDNFDTENLQTLIDEFNSELQNSGEKYKEAIALYKESKTAQDVDEAIKTAKDSMESAKNSLIQAHEKLKEIVLELRNMGADKYLDEVTGEDVEAEIEEAAQ